MFRTFRAVFSGLMVCLLFLSCGKELSSENSLLPGSGGNGTNSGTAVYILDGAPGNCSNPIISGSYIVGTPLNATSAVLVVANVATVGTYTVSTATINGIVFAASGTFTSIGIQSILLTGSGTPTAVGTFNYKPGSNTCSFPITVTNVPAGPVAAGTLNCTNATFAGVYTQSISLSGTNTVTIPVNVTTAGSYSINTTATNGVTFSGSGNLALGAQSIVLTGTGTPTNAGTVSFTVSLGASTCSFSITFLPAPPPAAGVLDCAGITDAGVYTQGTALSASNTLSIPVNVTTPGLYNITSAANGVTFSGSGVLPAGAQTIVLTGSGTPANAGPFSFSIDFGTSNCSYSITFLAASTDFLKCSIDGGAITNFNTNLSGSLFPGTFAVDGESATQNLQITVNKTSGAAITVGTYNNASPTNTAEFCADQLSNLGTTQTWIDTSPNSNIFRVNITSITATVVTGTFSGNLVDLLGGGGTKVISNGSFSITY